MRVALFVHCFFPEHFYGTETYTLELAKNLPMFGHDPVVVSAIFPGEPKKPKLITTYEYDGVPVYVIDKNYFPNTRVQDTYYQPAIRQTYVDLLREIRPDIVHVMHLINHTGVLLEAIHSLNLPIVATLTDFFGFCFNNKLEAADGSLCQGPNSRRTNCLACYLKASSQNSTVSPLSRLAGRPPVLSWAATAIERITKIPGLRKSTLAGQVLDITRRPNTLAACYGHYHAVIAPTQFLKNAYLRNGLTIPIHEIRFGVDLPRKPKPAREKAVPIRFGFIGQIAAHKGTDILVDAFARLPPGNAELLIYGPEDQDPAYTARLKSLANGRAIAFKGTFAKNGIAEVLAGMDFLVIPSRWYENSPLVLLNALASHTPVIVSDVEGMTEFVNDEQNGFVFSRGSVDDLERVLRQIVTQPGKARDMSLRTSYARNTKTMTAEVVAVYEKVFATQ
jgi:glycosyltransferase involved in cell wall biosynthesis